MYVVTGTDTSAGNTDNTVNRTTSVVKQKYNKHD